MRPALFFTAVALHLTLGATGCLEDDEDDDIPPRVLSVEPSATIVPVNATFRISFSEPLNPRTISSDVVSEEISVVLAPAIIFEDAFFSDFENPPLSESRQDDLIAITAELDDDDSSITVTPSASLAEGTAFSLLISGEVRDTRGNPLVDFAGLKAAFRWDFTTDAGAPEVDETDIGQSGVVVPNRRRITVTFDQPVAGIGNDTLTITGSPPVNIEAILVDETSTTATLLLNELGSGCARLGPNSAYTLSVGTGITSLATGQALLSAYSEPFEVSAACDTTANVLSAVSAIASDVSASVRFTSSKPSTTELRFGLAGGVLDCLGATCPIVGVPTTTANAVHNALASGLSVNVNYDFMVIAEDEVGFAAVSRGTFHTEALPKIAVNEMLADTEAGFDDNAGEFVEIKSFESSAAIPLAGWKLRITKVDDGATSDCVLPESAPTLAAGAYLVLADTPFDIAIYPGLQDSAVYRYTAFCGLQNEEIVVELVDPSARAVSSMTAPAPRAGKSVERTAPDAPDAATSFCFSRADTGPTPGEENGVTSRGCED